jgi:MFS family permease
MTNPRISKTVVILSLVSLLSDVASEMLYPVIPLYLKQIGFGILWIGAIEAVAEITAGVSKGYFGQWSDEIDKRKPFIQWGYAMSAVSKPLMLITAAPVWIVFTRILDRLGKGLRTAPREALLALESTATTANAVFGFHRSVDTIGSIVGQLGALFCLGYSNWNITYEHIFFIAFVPSILGIVVSLFIKEKKQVEKPSGHRSSFFANFSYWDKASARYKQIVFALILFALFNSSDVFLILQAESLGIVSPNKVPLFIIKLCIMYNATYALFAYPFGRIADRFHPKYMLILGLLIFSVSYLSISVASKTWHLYVIFAVYGLYAAATDGVSKAWLSLHCAKTEKGTALGLFSSLQSIAMSIASAVGGIIWHSLGSGVLFTMAGIVAVIVAFLISGISSKNAEDVIVTNEDLIKSNSFVPNRSTPVEAIEAKKKIYSN